MRVIQPATLNLTRVRVDQSTIAITMNCTYTRTGTTVVVALSQDFNFKVGHRVYVDFTSGAATDGSFEITVTPTAGSIVFEHGSSGSTSGNCTIRVQQWTGAFNVDNVIDRGVGLSIINFTTPLASIYGVALATATRTDAVGYGRQVGVEIVNTMSAYAACEVANDGADTDCYLNLLFIGD